MGMRCTEKSALARVTQQYQHAALANNSHRTYNTGVKSYARFCTYFGISIFPASDLSLAKFAAFMAKTCKASTIKTYISGIRNEHLVRGMQFKATRERFPLQQVLKGIKRTNGDTAKPKLPITKEVLADIWSWKQANPPVKEEDKHKAVCIWAASLTGVFGMLRKDNLTVGKQEAYNAAHHIRRKDVAFLPATDKTVGLMWLRLCYSKTNQDQSRTHWIPLVETRGALCPVTAVKPLLHISNTNAEDQLFIV